MWIAQGPNSSKLLFGFLLPVWVSLPECISILAAWQTVETILGIILLEAGQFAQFQCC